MSKKSLIWIASISLSILMINTVVLVLWQSKFPDFPVFGGSIKQAQVNKDKPTQDNNIKSPVLSPDIPAYETMNKLASTLIVPKGWAKGEESYTISSPIDESCPLAFDKTQPVLSKSISLDRIGDGVSGGVAQVFIYSAGFGALALDDIKKQVKECGRNAWISSSNIKLGVETIIVNDIHGNQVLSGPGGRTVFTRFGDVVASVSIRGKSSNQSESILTSWVKDWEKILVRVCPNLNSTVGDANRSALSKTYSGWITSEKIELTEQEQSQAEIEGRGLVLNASSTIPGSDLSIPSSAVDTKEKVDLYQYPDTLTLANIATKPIKPGLPPSYPTKPEAKLVKGSQSDPIGPGCGWIFTGQSKPVFDPNSISSFETDKLVASSQLFEETKQLWLAKWQYGQDMRAYNKQVDDWNSWASEANLAISRALWGEYDSKLLDYQKVLDTYKIDYQNWVTQCSPIATPSPSATTSPADSTPIISSIDCNIQPSPPIVPVIPNVPRL